MSVEGVITYALVGLAWLTVIPLAGLAPARVLTTERITDGIRGWVEVRWPGSLLHYWLTCPTCCSTWTVTAASAAGWWALGLPVDLSHGILFLILTASAVEMARTMITFFYDGED